MTNSTTIEKRGRNFDGVVNEWRLTAGDLQNEITGSQADCHNYSSDYFCIKAANEEMLEHLDTARRENENLQTVIETLKQQNRNLQIEKETEVEALSKQVTVMSTM